MKKILVTVLLCIMVAPLAAQKYGTAIGLRMGDKRYGISVRQRIMKRVSSELLMEVEPNAFQATILPKYHFLLVGQGLNWYVGAGAHVGQMKDFGATYGFDVMTGIEWKLPALPLTISADVKPAYNLKDQDWFEFPAAISVHYIIAKETKAKRKKARKKRRRKKARRERREERRSNDIPWWKELFVEEGTD